MPLKLLKRSSKQYNVVSKSTFVISVTLLDNGVMECTLDAESTGNDCLYNISQRLGLHQSEFFGLRYISRGVPPRERWIELDVSLKKQLDKYAEDNHLALCVMFYIQDVNLLKDEMTRYHYFLQLKSDVVNGRLNCTIDQAISLGAYSLQAEFGDFDPERHTLEYLKDFAILPKDIIIDNKYGDGLYDAVTRQYRSLIGFPPSLGEIYYISVVIGLEGYGEESYPGQDEEGNDVLICVSSIGLSLRRRDWSIVNIFKWNDILNIIGHKKILTIQSSQSKQKIVFTLSDPHVVKYIIKISNLQASFTKEYTHGSSVVGNGSRSLSESNEFYDIDSMYSAKSNFGCETSMLSGKSCTLSSSSSKLGLGLVADGTSSLLPSYRPAPDYDTAVLLKFNQDKQRLVHVLYDTQKPEEEEPIYQNEIVSKINSIELRDSNSSQERTHTPTQDFNSTVASSSLSTDDIYKPPPPYPGYNHSSRLRSSSSLAHAEILHKISNDLQNGRLSAANSHDSLPKVPGFSNTVEVMDPKILEEFNRIPKSKPNPCFSRGLKNLKMNRCLNILPYDDNSIILKSKGTNPSGYINASPITVNVGEKNWKYIVTQLPLPGSRNIISLWELIWESDCRIIIVLDKDVSSMFYPCDSILSISFGDFTINQTKNKRINSTSSIAIELILSFQNKKERRIWILPYDQEWKDNAPIHTEHFLCFLEEVNSVERKVNEEGCPLTVICENGAGKCGVFVLSDILLRAADAGHKIRCDSMLGILRSQRMLLLTHPQQYIFVLQTLNAYLQQSRLI